VDGDGDLMMEDGRLGGFWELRDGTVCGGVVDEMEQSFVRRQRTEPFYPVFGGDYLLPPPYCGNGLVRDFVPSSDYRR